VSIAFNTNFKAATRTTSGERFEREQIRYERCAQNQVRAGDVDRGQGKLRAQALTAHVTRLHQRSAEAQSATAAIVVTITALSATVHSRPATVAAARPA
jgi:hypothetical protein